MFTIALPKGALLKDSISTFKRAGLDFSDALDENNRSLTFESNCKRAKALLVRNGDVPVYVVMVRLIWVLLGMTFYENLN